MTGQHLSPPPFLGRNPPPALHRGMWFKHSGQTVENLMVRQVRTTRRSLQTPCSTAWSPPSPLAALRGQTLHPPIQAAEEQTVSQQDITVGKRDNSKKKEGFQEGLGRRRRRVKEGKGCHTRRKAQGRSSRKQTGGHLSGSARATLGWCRNSSSPESLFGVSAS